MRKIIVLITALLFLSVYGFTQDGSSLEQSFAFCTSNGTYTYQALTGTTAQSGPNYGCLGSQPNPTWMHLLIDVGGNLDFSLSAGSDIDFAIWGPYASLSAARSGVAAGDASIDCSFSSTNNETPSISGASTGQYYILLVTNFANIVQTISLSKTGGTGTTNCTILPPSVTTVGATVNGLSADCSGNVTNENGQTVTERGIAYSTSVNPTISGSHVAHASGGTGSYTVTLSALSQGTTYHYRAYATNSNGTSYGGDATFTTPSNQPPVANNDSWTVYVNDWRSIPGKPTGGVLINDTDGDGDPLTVGNPGNRTTNLGVSVYLASDGSFTYTAPANQVDVTDSFTYYANDGQANSNTATVLIYLRKAIYNGTAPNGTVGNWNGGYFPNSITDVIFQAGNIQVSTSMVIRNLQIYNAATFYCTGGATLTVNNSIGNENRTGMTLSSPVILNSGIKIHD